MLDRQKDRWTVGHWYYIGHSPNICWGVHNQVDDFTVRQQEDTFFFFTRQLDDCTIPAVLKQQIYQGHLWNNKRLNQFPETNVKIEIYTFIQTAMTFYTGYEPREQIRRCTGKVGRVTPLSLIVIFLILSPFWHVSI